MVSQHQPHWDASFTDGPSCKWFVDVCDSFVESYSKKSWRGSQCRRSIRRQSQLILSCSSRWKKKGFPHLTHYSSNEVSDNFVTPVSGETEWPILTSIVCNSFIPFMGSRWFLLKPICLLARAGYTLDKSPAHRSSAQRQPYKVSTAHQAQFGVQYQLSSAQNWDLNQRPSNH